MKPTYEELEAQVARLREEVRHANEGHVEAIEELRLSMHDRDRLTARLAEVERERDLEHKALVEEQGTITALAAALERLIATYEALFANDPSGAATRFEIAMTEAKAALDQARGGERMTDNPVDPHLP